MTIWQDEAAMKTYRNSGAHLKAMPKLRQWCDQSATARWQQNQAVFPSWQEAEQRLTSLSTNGWQRQTV
jgi:hypothetical protein